MMEFVPNEDTNKDYDLPFFEDARNADGIKGYSTTKSVRQLKSLITTSMSKLGGAVTSFIEGKYGTRHGFQIRFTYRKVEGRLDVACLPIKNETESRIDQAKRHALYSVNLLLEAQFQSHMMLPKHLPLMPWLLNAKGQTMTEYLVEQDMTPALPEQTNNDEQVIEGEFTDAD